MSRADQRFTEIANNIATIATLNAGIDESVLSNIRAELNKVFPLLAPQENVETIISELLETVVTEINGRDEPEKRGLVGFCELDGSLVQCYEKNEDPLKAFFISELSALRVTNHETVVGGVFPTQRTSSTATESTRLQQIDHYSHADVVPFSPNQPNASTDHLVEPLLPLGQSEPLVNTVPEGSSYLPPVSPPTVRRPIHLVVSQAALTDPMKVMQEGATQDQDTLLIYKSKNGAGIVVLHSGMLSLLSSGAQKDEIIKGATVLLSGDEIIFSKEYKPHFAKPLTKIVLNFLSYALPENVASLDEETAIKAVRDCIESIRSRMLVPEVMKALSETDDVLDAASIFQKQYQTKIIEKLIFDLCAKQHDYEKRIANKQEYRGIGLFQSCNHSASKKKAAIVDVIAVAVSVFRGEAVDPAEIARIRALPATKEGTLKALCDRFYNMIPAPTSVPSAGPR